MDLEMPRLVSWTLYNANFDLPRSKLLTSNLHPNLKHCDILYRKESRNATGEVVDLGVRDIPYFKPDDLFDIDLSRLQTPVFSELCAQLSIHPTTKLNLTEVCLMNPKWDVLSILFRLHPSLRVFSAWGLSVPALDEVYSYFESVSSFYGLARSITIIISSSSAASGICSR